MADKGKFPDNLSDLYFANNYWYNEQADVEQETSTQSDENKSAVRLRQYLELRSRQLQLDLDAANLFQGKTERGSITEDAIRRLLKASLPKMYSVGIGEVISTKGDINYQTQSKDVVIYDSTYSPIFGWGETGFHLFPIESVYAIIEVKKIIDTPELLQGIKQAVEVRSLAEEAVAKPFTALIAFSSTITTNTLARHISKLDPESRVDFVLILNPKLTQKEQRQISEAGKDFQQSDYIAHWLYHTPGIGGGPVELLTTYEAKQKYETQEIRLTWARNEHALMWFYLLLISSISVGTTPINLWKYMGSDKANLGYKGEFPFLPTWMSKSKNPAWL